MPVEPTNIPVPRSGAVLVRKTQTQTSALDLRFLRALAEGVQGAACEQGRADEELDDAQASTIRGNYDWRAFLKEEFLSARKQAEEGRQ